MIFRRALIRLTVTYALVQLVLFGAFALGIYAFVTGNFDFDASEHQGEAAVASAEQGFATLRTGLISGYAILVVLLPLSSYFMARAALAPLRRSYELQQRFVDAASHEFRSPLSVIQGELELALTKSRTAGQYRAAIGHALVAAGGLTRLTNDLLLLSRENTDELEATFEPVPLAELVQTAVKAHPTEGARITIAAAEPVTVFGSRELLARAVANVVDNAVKFSTPADHIEISVSSTGKVAEIRVKDDGPGMSDAEIRQAFDRFWRAQDARSAPGFGLGLSLVQQISAAHHGKAFITSTPGAGTVVTISIPLTLISRSDS